MSEILVIDGEQPLAQDLATALEQRGYDVKQLENGKEGLAYAQTNLPSLIVLCVELPKPSPSGYAICNKLKKDGNLKKIPLVITSKEATPETFAQHRKLKTRAEEYVLKPFEIDDILQTIDGFVPAPGGDDAADGEEEKPSEEESEGADEDVNDALDGLEDEASEADASSDGDGSDDEEKATSDADSDGDSEDDEALAGLEEVEEDKAEESSGDEQASDDAADASDDDSSDENEDSDDDSDSDAEQDDSGDDDASVSGASSGTDPTLAFLLGGEDNMDDTGLRLAVLQKMNTLRREASDYKAKFVELEAKLKIAEDMARNTQADLAQTKSSSSSSAREALDLKKKLQAKEKELLEARDEVFQKEEAVVELQEKMDQISQNVLDAKQEAAGKDVEIASLNSRIESLTQARDDLEEQVNDRLQKAESEVRDLKRKLDKTKKTSDKDISALKLKLETLETESTSTGQELSDAYSRIKDEETLRQRAKQALDIALTVLTGEGEAVTSESDED